MSTEVAGPARDDWHTPAELAPLIRRNPWTVREHLRNGTLHGHFTFGRWSIRGTVADAFLEGLDPAAQQRACGCQALRVVKPRRGRPA